MGGQFFSPLLWAFGAYVVLGLVNECGAIPRSFFAQPFAYLPFLVTTLQRFENPFWVGACQGQYGSIFFASYEVLVSLREEEASVRRRYPPQTCAFLLYVGISTIGWMLVVTFLVITPQHSSMSADSWPRNRTVQLRAMSSYLWRSWRRNGACSRWLEDSAGGRGA